MRIGRAPGAAHSQDARREYAERHALILSTLTRDFAGVLEPVRSVTGMHLAAMFRRSGVAAEAALAERAAREGIAFDRLSPYYLQHPRAGIVLGYGGIGSTDIVEGLRRLRRLMGTRPVVNV